ncbi:hypothetical protein PoB_003581000 [Plakobranchus ocellatus]|uniref:Uncharacterized protein n=1 Tax=Plakobranchus ocellatus TaxID=259542 RepID=A0AAV4APL8_9GAST|nr:hypothetical protein PoB_003581000 [Plakobranchus ocellatus]
MALWMEIHGLDDMDISDKTRTLIDHTMVLFEISGIDESNTAANLVIGVIGGSLVTITRTKIRELENSVESVNPIMK